MTASYQVVVTVVRALIQGYGRLTVRGPEHVPHSGPVLILANHDSPLDAFIIGVAARRQRQIRFLTKRSLWRHRLAGALLDRLEQIPIERQSNDSTGLDAAIAALRTEHCVCVFPEGTISRGQQLRVRSGAARILTAAPNTAVVGCAVTGATDLKRLRFRARVGVTFFATSQEPDAEPAAMVQSVMDTVRRLAPSTR